MMNATEKMKLDAESEYKDQWELYTQAGVAYEANPGADTELAYYEVQDNFYRACFTYLLALMAENSDVLQRLKDR